MKSISLLIAGLLAIPTHVFAVDDGVKFNIYLAGKLQQSVALVGPNAKFKFSPSGEPNSTLEFRLIAPEPVIVEMKETAIDGRQAEAVGRVKMPTPGSSVAVAEIKEAKFHHPYVLVRAD